MFLLSAKAESYIEKVIKIVTPAIFFLPLILNSDFYFPFVTPRNFLFRILITVIFGLYLTLLVFNKDKYRPFGSKVLVSYIAFALLMTLSSIFGGDFLYSFWGNAERMEGLLGLYYLVGFFIVLTGVYHRKKSWLFLLYTSAFVSFLAGFVALSQALGIDLLLASSGGARVSATLGNPTYLATYALFHLFFAAYLFFKNTDKKLKFELIGFYIVDLILIYLEIKSQNKGGVGILTIIFRNIYLAALFLIPQILINLNFFLHKHKKNIAKISYQTYFVILALLNFVALFNTQTRGALVGIFVALLSIAVFLLFSRYVNRKFKYSIAALLVLFILLVSSIFVFKQSSFIQADPTLRRVAGISLSDATTETRLLTWQISMKGFMDKPILGWGEEKFYVVFNKYFPTEIFEDLGSRVWFDRPHNVFIQQLIHGGALGLLAYLAIFWFAFKNLFIHYRKTHDLKTISILGGLIIAYMVQNFFVFDSLNSYILAVLLLVVTVFLANNKRIEAAQVAPSDNKMWIAIALFFIVLINGYYFNIPAARANKDFVYNFKALRDVHPSTSFDEEANQDLIDTMNNNYLGRFEFRQVYSEYAYSLLQVKETPIYKKGRTMELAETALLGSIEEQSDNVRHYSFLANLYLAGALTDPMYAQKNIKLIEENALELSPTRTQLYYTLGSAYMTLQKHEESIESFIKAKDLSPHVFESYQNLLSAYLSSDRTEEAKELLATIEDNAILSAAHYSNLGKILNYFSLPEEAVIYMESAVEHYPQDGNLLIQLIVYYDAMDEQEKVKAGLEKLKIIDPALADRLNINLDL